MSLQTMNHLTLKEKEKKPISAAMYVILMRKSSNLKDEEEVTGDVVDVTHPAKKNLNAFLSDRHYFANGQILPIFQIFSY